MALYVPSRSVTSADCGVPPLMAKVYLDWSTVLQSSSLGLCEASTSQFLTRFSTNCGRLPASWSDRFAVAVLVLNGVLFECWMRSTGLIDAEGMDQKPIQRGYVGYCSLRSTLGSACAWRTRNRHSSPHTFVEGRD